jgi:hypothetical protein
MLMVGKSPRRRRVKLGIYPDLSLSKAREKAKDTLAHERFKSAETISIRFENALGDLLSRSGGRTPRNYEPRLREDFEQAFPRCVGKTIR